ncbi:porin [Burkholderia contaminans]|nr:porin [Burkholderia contaminans]
MKPGFIRTGSLVASMLVGMATADGAQAQSSVTLYGLIDTSIAYVDNQGNNGKPLGSGPHKL